ncbi:MAG TPA: ABC transporter, partial [Opitutaceae bacterium]
MHLESFRAARWVRTSNLVLQAILFVTLMAGLNYLSLYYAARFDITRLHRRSLSAETLSYLAQLNKPVLIFVTFDEHSQEDKYAQAFIDLAPLLGEYVYATEKQQDYKRISWSSLDVYQRPREAQILKAEQNEVLVVCDGRTRILHFNDLYQFKDGKRSG